MISHFLFPAPKKATRRAFGADDDVFFEEGARPLVKNARFLMSAYIALQAARPRLKFTRKPGSTSAAEAASAAAQIPISGVPPPQT